jgi:filamentous hemagglutinin
VSDPFTEYDRFGLSKTTGPGGCVLDQIEPEKVPEALGKGSTANLSKGTTLARNLREQLAVEQAMSNPAVGRELPLKITDPRWPADDSWVKMQQLVDSGESEGKINVHYLQNTNTGAVDDFKIVLPGVR